MYVQLIGIIGFVFLAISFMMKKREKVLTNQVISYIFYSIHYLLLNARSGYIISVTNLVKCLFLTVKDKHKWLQNNIMLFVFVLIYVLATWYTYQDIFSILPALAAIIYTSMLWQGTIKEIRIGGIINSSLWIIYNIHVLSYVGMFSDSSILLINVIMLIRMWKDEQNNRGKTKTITG